MNTVVLLSGGDIKRTSSWLKFYLEKHLLLRAKHTVSETVFDHPPPELIRGTKSYLDGHQLSPTLLLQLHELPLPCPDL